MLGASCGLIGGVVGVALVGHDAGRGRGAPGTLRGDLDRVEAEGLAARLELASSIQALMVRLEDLEKRAGGAQDGARAQEVAAALQGVAADLRALRDAFTRDLRTAEARLVDLERRTDELSTLAALAPKPASRAASDAEEAQWVNLARDPSDPYKRFSALVLLGPPRPRTDRSAAASYEALADADVRVRWQAVRNLAGWNERGAAKDIAALLRHDDVSLRSVAYDALVKLGAPAVPFVASALPEERKPHAEALERWAADVQ